MVLQADWRCRHPQQQQQQQQDAALTIPPRQLRQIHLRAALAPSSCPCRVPLKKSAVFLSLFGFVPRVRTGSCGQ
jgi:hypothetical protein